MTTGGVVHSVEQSSHVFIAPGTDIRVMPWCRLYCTPNAGLQVLDFITNLTISVHAHLLKRHRQPAGTFSTSLLPAFGSGAARFTGSVPPVQQQAACSGRPDESLAALGEPLDTTAVQMLRRQRQQHKKPKERHVPVFVVPAPVCTKCSEGSANVGTEDICEALRGWDMQS